MGYSAEVIDNRPAGDLAVIPAERVESVWAALVAEEGGGGIGHISWCNELDKYEGTTAEKVAEVLSDFGFDGTEEDGEGGVVIHYWGGDKIGSSWDGVLAAIAVGVDPALHLTWLMQGEDGLHWAEDFQGGVVTSRDVTINW